jgi:hypothetical protein
MKEGSIPLLACALVALALGCGSGGSDPEATSVQPIPAVTQPTITQSPGPALKPKGQAPTSTPGTTSSPVAPKGTGQGQATIDSCPAQMSKRVCRELIQAAKRGGTGSPGGPLSCAQLTKDQCEEIMRQLGRHP